MVEVETITQKKMVEVETIQIDSNNMRWIIRVLLDLDGRDEWKVASRRVMRGVSPTTKLKNQGRRRLTFSPSRRPESILSIFRSLTLP